jgi:hypothetical protein
MSGFSNTPPANEFRNHTSWGRTRSPKNIISQHRKGTDGTNPLTVTATEFTGDFLTENQRFLHITHTAAAGGTLEVWGYMHASGVWGKIGSSITTSTTSIHSVVEVFGVDKIKIKAVGENLTSLFLACSTF